MALARVKVWNPGDVLTAADLNAEFNNLLNNPISLISPTTGVITFTTAQTFPANQVSGSLTAAGSWVSGLNGALSSQSGTFTANQYLLQSTNGTQSFVLNSTASFAVSVGTAGPAAGGRDVAAVFASTYVHWYAISTGSGSTALAGIVSSQAPPTGPVMPANYSAWAYLGASPYSSASTTVTSTHQFRGNSAFFLRPRDNALLSAGAVQSSLATVSVTSAVPTNASKMILQIIVGAAVAGTISVDTVSTFHATSALAGSIGTAIVPFTSNGLTYQMAGGGGSLNLDLMGYVMPNGDV